MKSDTVKIATHCIVHNFCLVYIKQKYAKYKIPLEETEWVGLDLNEACRKLQDIEDNTKKTPLKL